MAFHGKVALVTGGASGMGRVSALRLAAIPGIEMKVGWGGPIYVALLGNNDAEMQRVIADLRQKIQSIRGITDIEVSLKEGTPALSVRLKPELASEYGLTYAQLGTTLRALIGGENGGCSTGTGTFAGDDPIGRRYYVGLRANI